MQRARALTIAMITSVVAAFFALVGGPFSERSLAQLSPPTATPSAQPVCGPSPPTPSFQLPSNPPLVVTVSTDRRAYTVGERLTFTLTVTNPTDTPVTLLFGAPLTDFAVSAASTNAEVWRWSHGRAIPLIVTYCTFGPGQTITRTEHWDQQDNQGQQVPAGEYVVIGELGTPLPRPTTAPVQFTIGQRATSEAVQPPIPIALSVAAGLSAGLGDVTVVNQGDQRAGVVRTGNVVRIAVSPGATIHVVEAFRADCTLVSDQPNVLICTVTSDAQVNFATAAAASQTETVRLFPGCTNVALTWPTGTPTGVVAAAVSPSTALESIWRYDAARTLIPARFIGFSPQFPQASDLATVNRLDAVFICMREAGTLTRPVPASTSQATPR